MTTLFTTNPEMRDLCQPAVIGIHPFLKLQAKRTNDKVLKRSLRAIDAGYIPNDNVWHKEFKTENAIVLSAPSDGRWLFGSDEAPAIAEMADDTTTTPTKEPA